MDDTPSLLHYLTYTLLLLLDEDVDKQTSGLTETGRSLVLSTPYLVIYPTMTSGCAFKVRSIGRGQSPNSK